MCGLAPTGVEPVGCKSLKLKVIKIKKRAKINPLFLLALQEGFEPSVRCRTSVFETDTFDHSDTAAYIITTLKLKKIKVQLKQQ